MRCSKGASGFTSFDEFRLLVDATSRKVTVMFGNFDSASEQQRYQFFVDELRKAHQQSH